MMKNSAKRVRSLRLIFVFIFTESLLTFAGEVFSKLSEIANLSWADDLANLLSNHQQFFGGALAATVLYITLAYKSDILALWNRFELYPDKDNFKNEIGQYAQVCVKKRRLWPFTYKGVTAKLIDIRTENSGSLNKGIPLVLRWQGHDAENENKYIARIDRLRKFNVALREDGIMKIHFKESKNHASIKENLENLKPGTYLTTFDISTDSANVLQEYFWLRFYASDTPIEISSVHWNEADRVRQLIGDDEY